jgi:hypothetical protein
MAILQLFKARETAKAESTLPVMDDSKLAFERIHYEYLIYHSTIFMVYDPDFEPLVSNSVWLMIESYFSNSPLPTDSRRENWPVLSMPYRPFRFIIAISRLGRRCPLTAEDTCIASAVWEEMIQWSSPLADKQEASVGTLFILAAKILLQQILVHQTDFPGVEEMNQLDIQKGLAVLQGIEIGNHFSRSLVWPLAVLYVTVTAPEEKLIIREKMRTVLEKSDGGGPLSVSDERVDQFLVVPGVAALGLP